MYSRTVELFPRTDAQASRHAMHAKGAPAGFDARSKRATSPRASTEWNTAGVGFPSVPDPRDGARVHRHSGSTILTVFAFLLARGLWPGIVLLPDYPREQARADRDRDVG